MPSGALNDCKGFFIATTDEDDDDDDEDDDDDDDDDDIAATVNAVVGGAGDVMGEGAARMTRSSFTVAIEAMWSFSLLLP